MSGKFAKCGSEEFKSEMLTDKNSSHLLCHRLRLQRTSHGCTKGWDFETVLDRPCPKAAVGSANITLINSHTDLWFNSFN